MPRVVPQGATWPEMAGPATACAERRAPVTTSSTGSRTLKGFRYPNPPPPQATDQNPSQSGVWMSLVPDPGLARWMAEQSCGKQLANLSRAVKSIPASAPARVKGCNRVVLPHRV